MSTEKDLENRMVELRERWRLPPEPPLDEMWEQIESQAFGRHSRAIPARWIRTLLPLAATLVLGFGLGRVVPAGRTPAGAAADGTPRGRGVPVLNAGTSEAPFVGIASDYLERVTGLLVSLASESRDGKSLEYSATSARDLLATTRLLMDSPQPLEPHLQGLLEDLELVLAQIARLPARPDAPDVYLIDQALDQRDVIPRLRVFLAENPSSP